MSLHEPRDPKVTVSDFASEVKQILRAENCRFERHGRGDHDIRYSPKTNRRFPVDSKIRSRHTANAVLKQAGIDKRF